MLTQPVAIASRPTAGAGSDRLLRAALRLDAAACGLSAVLLLAGAPLLEEPLGAPRAFLWPVGVFLGAYAAAVGILSTRPHIPQPAARAVIGFNALWAFGSVALVAGGGLPLTALGAGMVLAQAAAVAGVAVLQFLGLRRARPACG
jgi:hypothetical protein